MFNYRHETNVVDVDLKKLWESVAIIILAGGALAALAYDHLPIRLYR